MNSQQGNPKSMGDWPEVWAAGVGEIRVLQTQDSCGQAGAQNLNLEGLGEPRESPFPP